METVTSYISSLDLNFDSLWKIALILLVGILLLGVLGRVIFGKRSALNHAVSSAIGILFIYGLNVVLKSLGADFQEFIAPMPFVSISDGQLILFSFGDAHYTTLCAELLSMIILAFLVNLADSWLPKGKNLFTWLLFRTLTVLIAYILHLIVVGLFATYLPEGIVTYAPVILLALLLLLLLTGVLKVVVGGLLGALNPIIGGLYTFFFSTVIGKQVSKAMLTTAILCALVIGLRQVGITAIAISTSALVAYVPFILILLVIWFIVFKIL